MAKTKSSEMEESAMGFKDKQKALDTLKMLDGRDISYQYHVITGFVSRAKRTLQITKDEEKRANLKDGLKIFEGWLVDYKENNRGKENFPYLPLDLIQGFALLARKYDLSDNDFYDAYKKEKGDYKSLRGVKARNGETTWDIERNHRLKETVAKMKEEHVQWYETDVGDFRGLPTREHTRCIMLGYSPDPTKLRKLVSQVMEKFGDAMEIDDDKMAAGEGQGDEREEGEGKTKNDKLEKGESRKRRHDSASSSSSSSSSSSTSSSSREKKEPERKMARLANTEKEDNGLGFKDKERALQSIRSMKGRDVSYRYHAIVGLIKRAERVITCTKDPEKISNMKEAIAVFEDWVTDYKVNNRASENLDYLPIDVLRAYAPLAGRYRLEENGFLRAYERVEGDYKKLRSLRVENSEVTWDVERNKKLRPLVDDMKEKRVQLFNNTDGELGGLPTEEHARCIMWGFSHEPAKLKKLVATVSEKLKPVE